MSNVLRERFCRALQAVGATADASASFEELAARYREPHRHYHTLEHIDACLAWLDRFSASAERPAEVELALWFHDAVYDPQRNDNESRSAELARMEIGKLGGSRASIDRVASYVEATARHLPSTGDAALVVDIDLTILGVEKSEFAKFESQIRREYAHVPEPEYRLGRQQVLEHFLARPQIYGLPAFRELLEAPARQNLERSVAELSRAPR